MRIETNSAYLSAIGDIAKSIPITTGVFLVTGASGLIGSCVVDTLLYANKFLKCDFSIYALGRDEEKMRARFDSLATNKLHFIIQNICQSINIGVCFDYILHFASNADPRSYAIYPAETILTNVKGTVNMLDYCKKHIETRLFVSSTFEVYGKIDGVDVYNEDDFGLVDINSVRSGYPESKRCCELLTRSYCREFGVKAVIGRFSSIYGPTMLENDSKAHAQFLKNAVRNENIELKSKGEQVRTYTCVFDAVDAVFHVLFKGRNGEAFNIANGQSVITIAQLAQCIANIAGTKVVISHPDNIEIRGFSKPQNCILSTGKIESECCWSPKYELFTGIQKTIDILKAGY